MPAQLDMQAKSADEFANSLRLLWADASNFGQSRRVGGEHAFDRAEVAEQSSASAANPGRPCSRNSRLEARRFGFRSKSAQNLLLSACLIGQQPKDAQRCSGSGEWSTGTRHIAASDTRAPSSAWGCTSGTDAGGGPSIRMRDR